MNNQTAKKNNNLKYKQVVQYLEDEINSGRIKIGEQIPTELELCEMFKMGRMTVNKAVNVLVQNGIVRRTAGKGSFVVRKVSKSISTMRSFTRDMEKVGMKAGSKLLSFSLVKASSVPIVAAELHVDGDAELICFERLRFGDDIPIALSHSYLLGSYFPDFNPGILEKSLDEYFEKQNIETTGFIIRVQALMATKTEKQLLGFKTNEVLPLLRSTTIRFNNKQPFEYTLTSYSPNEYEYVFTSGEVS